MVIDRGMRLVGCAIVLVLMAMAQAPVASAQPLQLTFSAANEYQPRWSPDGAKIAFGSNRSGNVDITVPVEGATWGGTKSKYP
jgi:hypothetical protein